MTALEVMRQALEALKSSRPTRRIPTRRMSDDDHAETGREEHIAAMLALRAEILRLEAAEFDEAQAIAHWAYALAAERAGVEIKEAE